MLDFKLKNIISSEFNNVTFNKLNFAPLKKELPKEEEEIVVQIKKDEVVNDTATTKKQNYWAARCACVLAVLPIIFLTKNEDITRKAACLHLITMPFTSHIFHDFNDRRCCMYPTYARVSSQIACHFCLFLGNAAAICLCLFKEYSLLAHNLLSLTLCLGSFHLLLMMSKDNVIRIMTCTAAAATVILLSIAAVLTSSLSTARHFYQSTALPLLILYLETSRVSPQ